MVYALFMQLCTMLYFTPFLNILLKEYTILPVYFYMNNNVHHKWYTLPPTTNSKNIRSHQWVLLSYKRKKVAGWVHLYKSQNSEMAYNI